MKLLNLGSCAIDHVYQVPWLVRPGESLPSLEYQVHPGGKGLNQSLALAYAGAEVSHAGKLGEDGSFLKTLLDDAGVNTSLLEVAAGPSGHAFIQVTPDGENAIVLFGGTNKQITEADVQRLLAASQADFLLLQNETSALEATINLAADQGKRIVFNAAPMTAEVASLPLARLELLIVNEIEGEAITGKAKPDGIIKALGKLYPNTSVLLTLGAEGARFASQGQTHQCPAHQVKAVDTTGAGDTFTGYFLAGYVAGLPIEDCLAQATKAAALCVTRPGAATSIPRLSELAQLN